MIRRFSTVEHGMTMHAYATPACRSCNVNASCTISIERRIKRWEREDVVDAMQAGDGCTTACRQPTAQMTFSHSLHQIESSEAVDEALAGAERADG